MTITCAIIISCWIILLAYWTFGAFFQKKTKENLSFKSRITYSLLLLFSYLLLLFSSKIAGLNYILIKVSVYINILSLILAIWGLIVCIYSRKALGNNWSRDVVIKKSHKLITTGPYKYVRHPIYSGLLLLFLGTAIAIGNLGSILGFILLFFNFTKKYQAEEVLMVKEFNGKYLEYKKKTKTLIPFLY